MLKSYKSRFNLLITACGDVLLIFIGFWLANFCYGYLNNASDPFSNQDFFTLSISSVLSFYLFGCYSDFKRKGFQKIFINNTAALLAISLVWLFWSGYAAVALAFMIQSVFIGLFRYGVWAAAQKSSGEKKVWVLSDDEEEREKIIRKLLNHSPGWLVLSGVYRFNAYKKINEYATEFDVLLLSSSIPNETRKKIIQTCMELKKEVLFIPDYCDLLFSTSNIQQIDDMMVYSIQPAQATKENLLAKRSFDLILSLLLLIIASPIILVLSLLIPLTSKGPAFYKQERIGLHGKPFFIYKFRSMKHNAETKTGPILALEKDSRITPIGKFIRATRLDELPQLFNVLQGDMSIVGPRPERDFFIQQFKKEVPYYEKRLFVKPGITGLAQIAANYATSVEDKLSFDLIYVRNYSVSLDIKILFQTIRVVIQRNQAQGVKEETAQKRHNLVISSSK